MQNETRDENKPKVGRPKRYPDGPPMENYTVRLPLITVRKARRIGGGYMAEGIRIAVLLHSESKG